MAQITLFVHSGRVMARNGMLQNFLIWGELDSRLWTWDQFESLNLTWDHLEVT